MAAAPPPDDVTLQSEREAEPNVTLMFAQFANISIVLVISGFEVMSGSVMTLGITSREPL